MDMVGAVYEQDLKQALEANPAQLKLLDEAVLRLLRVKEALGLFDRPMQYHDVKREQKTLLAPAHREIAQRVARESIVLLKNDNNVLPLEPGKLRSLAVVGALASDAMSMLGSWRAQGRAEDVVTILQGFERAAPKGLKVVYAPGADPRSDYLSGIDAA